MYNVHISFKKEFFLKKQYKLLKTTRCTLEITLVTGPFSLQYIVFHNQRAVCIVRPLRFGSVDSVAQHRPQVRQETIFFRTVRPSSRNLLLKQQYIKILIDEFITVK